MKVQTAVLLLCFFSGVFLSVVHAKPSPALMRELVALEKYLEKKEGSKGADDQNENPGEKPTGEELNDLESVLNQNKEHQNLGQVEENQQTETGQEEPNNENNNEGGETNTAEGSSGADKEAPHAGENERPTGQEVDVPQTKPKEGVPPENAEEEEGSTASGGEGEEEKPLEGQVEKGRDQIFEVLDEVTRNIKDALDKLSTLGEEFREQFLNDDRKFKELEDKDEQTKEKTKEKLGQLKTVVEDIQSAFGVKDTLSAGKKSVRENAPARRSHISDTEFLNTLHSLLTNN